MKAITFSGALEMVGREWVKNWSLSRGFYYRRDGVRVQTNEISIESKPGGTFRNYTISAAVFEELRPIAPRVDEFTEDDALKLGVKPIRVGRPGGVK